MTDESRFERQLSLVLELYTRTVDRAFDPIAIASLAATPRGRGRPWTAFGRPTVALPLSPALVLLIVAALVAVLAMAAVGAQLLRQRLAEADGLLPPDAIEDRLAEAIRGEADATYPLPAAADVCLVLEKALGMGDRELRFPDHTSPGWHANGCALGWDGGWSDPHLLVRARDTHAAEAEYIVTRALAEGPTTEAASFALTFGAARWESQGDGVCFADPCCPRPWAGVAVSAEPYFFVVTYKTPDETLRLATAVAAELGVDLAGLLDE